MLKKIALFSLVALGFIACEPSEAGHTELGALPQADYSLTYIDSNTVQMVSTSTGDPFLYQWEIDGVGTYTGESVEVFIGTMGTYDVSHTVFNQGGSASATGQIEILKDGPMPCIGAMEWLTECTSRTWKLAPQEGSLWVGPDANTTWWAIPATGPTDRPCLFNDEWIFILYLHGILVWGNGFVLPSPVPRLRFTFVQSPFHRGSVFCIYVLRLRFTFWLRSTVYGHGPLVAVTLRTFITLQT